MFSLTTRLLNRIF